MYCDGHIVSFSFANMINTMPSKHTRGVSNMALQDAIVGVSIFHLTATPISWLTIVLPQDSAFPV